MYCVIQEIKVKKIPAGGPKRIEVYETAYNSDGVARVVYGYRNSSECYERHIDKAYRISIHESYRENGKVRKRQTVICTISYYNIVDWGGWIENYITGSRWKDKVEVLGLPEEELVDMIYKKFQPIIDRVEAEFQQTEEYKAKEEQRRILDAHEQRVIEFMERYGVDRSEYNHCYDVFGELRSPEYLRKVKADCKARKEYERKSRKNSRSYYEDFFHNYTGGGFGESGGAAVRHDDSDKAMLKQFYRTLSKAYHPDSNPGKDTSAEMKLLNQLKSEWGV